MLTSLRRLRQRGPDRTSSHKAGSIGPKAKENKAPGRPRELSNEVPRARAIDGSQAITPVKLIEFTPSQHPTITISNDITITISRSMNYVCRVLKK